MKVKLIAWGQGDITVGDGTLNAEFETDLDPNDILWTKLQLKKMLSDLWDIHEHNIHVMTQEEFHKYTSIDD